MQAEQLDLGSSGRFVIERRVASGSHAELLLATPLAGGASRCIKRFHPGLADYGELLREIHDALTRASTPDSPRWLKREPPQWVESAQGPALVVLMEWVEGCTLARLFAWQRRSARQPALALALYLSRELLRALAEHAPALHGALEPHHVLLSREGRVVLTSACATPTIHGRGARYCRGILSVTLPWMDHFSPERVRGRAVDARSDLHTVGVMLFELLTTRHPFAGESRFQTLHAIMDGAHPPLSSLRPELPETLVRLVERLLAPSPEARPPTAAAALAELRAAFPDHEGAGLLAEAVRAASRGA